MIAFRRSQRRPSELTRLRVTRCVAVVGSLAAIGCSEGGTEPPANGAGTSSMSGSGGSATGNNGGSGNAMGGTSGGGSSGAGGSTGGGVEASTFYNFDTSAQGFRINYVCTAASTCMSIQPGMAPAGADAGADGGSGAPAEPDNGLATATFDDAVGNPQPGSVRVDIDFTAAGQMAVLALNFDTTDFSGRTMRAMVTVDSGAPAQLAAKMYLKSGEAYVFADSGQLTLTPGSWTPFSLLADMPTAVAAAGYDAADVREIGIEFAIPGATSGFAPAVIHVDTFQY